MNKTVLQSVTASPIQEWEPQWLPPSLRLLRTLSANA
jgi:hypothetical protein